MLIIFKESFDYTSDSVQSILVITFMNHHYNLTKKIILLFPF